MFGFVFITFVIVFNMCALIVNELLFEQTPELWRRPPGKCTPHVSVTSLMTFDMPKGQVVCVTWRQERAPQNRDTAHSRYPPLSVVRWLAPLLCT